MQHPAKMAPGLCHRILDHLEELGLLHKGDVLLDFMAGIGTTGLVGATRGYASAMVELEPKFIDLMVSYNCPGIPRVTIEVKELPADSGGWRTEDMSRGREEEGLCYSRLYYAKPVKARKRYVAHSKCRCGKPDWHPVHHVVSNKEHLEKVLGHPVDMQIIQGDARRLSELLKERGLIAVTSPPYGDAEARDRSKEASWGKEANHPRGDRNISQGIDSPGNIASLPDRPFVSVVSPPYEDSDVDGARKMSPGYFDKVGGIGHTKTIPTAQMGKDETYLSAMRQVYAEAAKVCKVLVTVTKNPTRNGKLRRLDKDTACLLQETGWRIVDYHRAILFEEQEVGHLFEGAKMQVKGRMSFFKRLSWQKGSPVAQWEDIMIAVNGKGTGFCGLTSPPYFQSSDTPPESDSSTVRIRGRDYAKQCYGDSPGQIGKLKG